mmetsp:Transcript_26007/g.50995  ORF Transcript_26007/g.50995 Transcript_26007/m.50995 type:complete len:281 (+) Transcript_26007:1671-2513(+)
MEDKKNTPDFAVICILFSGQKEKTKPTKQIGSHTQKGRTKLRVRNVTLKNQRRKRDNRATSVRVLIPFSLAHSFGQCGMSPIESNPCKFVPPEHSIPSLQKLGRTHSVTSIKSTKESRNQRAASLPLSFLSFHFLFIPLPPLHRLRVRRGRKILPPPFFWAGVSVFFSFPLSQILSLLLTFISFRSFFLQAYLAFHLVSFCTCQMQPNPSVVLQTGPTLQFFLSVKQSGRGRVNRKARRASIEAALMLSCTHALSVCIQHITKKSWRHAGKGSHPAERAL